MITRDDFIKVIDQTVEKYPLVAALRKAGDPRYFQQQEAMATMFAMLSQQIEVGMMEPFNKARDATVLADAALKGILPKGSPARVKVLIKNTSKTSPFALVAERVVTDSNSLAYVVDKPVTIPPASNDTEPGMGYAELVQRKIQKISHTVTEYRAFYVIEVPEITGGAYLADIDVVSASGERFTYSPGFTNVSVGQRVYHIEVDEYRRVFIQFGIAGVAGYQPEIGEVIDIYVTETSGNVQPQAGSPFSLEYTYVPGDALITMEMSEMLVAGADPLGIPELRELSKYPSIYNENAVYLGEFDFLIRRTVTNLPFLSVWNEQIEELARGPSIDNINRLFVSFKEPQNTSRDAIREEIKSLILQADDSFDVVFVPPIILNIGVTITVQVARVHDPEAVRAQIEAEILSEYGIASPMSLQGMMVLQYKRVYDRLKSKIPALQDSWSDFSVVIEDAPTKVLPEHWRFISAESLVVRVMPSDYNIKTWGR